MLRPPGSLVARRRERRRVRIAEAYGNLSDSERAQLRQLREEHDPLAGSARRPLLPNRFDGDLKRPR